MTTARGFGNTSCIRPASKGSDSCDIAGLAPVAGILPTPPLDTGALLRIQTLWPQAQQAFLRRDLSRWQCMALAETLGNAVTHCRFYKERLDTQKILVAIARLKQASSSKVLCLSGDVLVPEDMLALMTTTLAMLPFTSSSDLATDAEQFMAVGHDDVEAAVSVGTSGTTGPSKRIFATQGDLQASIDFFRYGMRYLLRSGVHEKVALLMSGTREGSVGDLLGRALAVDGIECEVCGFPETEESMLHHLKQSRPTCIVGVPAQLYALARHDQAASLRPFVHTVLLSGDTAVPSLRRAIAEAFECEVFLHYGLTEIGLGGFVECQEHTGCHGRELDLFIEIIDEQGRVHVPPAQGATPYGEIVITTLTRKAMPLLRYRTGDTGRLITASCACGSALWRLDPRGRGTGISGALLLPRSTGTGLLNYQESIVMGTTSHPKHKPVVSSHEATGLDYETVQNALYSLVLIRDFRVIVHDTEVDPVFSRTEPAVLVPSLSEVLSPEATQLEATLPEVSLPVTPSMRSSKGVSVAAQCVAPVHVVFVLCPITACAEQKNAGPNIRGTEIIAMQVADESKKVLASVLRQLEERGVCTHIFVATEGAELRQRLFPAMASPKKLLERRSDPFSDALYI